MRCIVNLCVVIVAFIFSCSANSSLIATQYLLAFNKKEINFQEFLWDGPNDTVVSEATRNWNRPIYELWGVSDRYPGTQGMPIPNVRPYSETDPGFSGPNGEEFGIEIEFGDTSITPRSNNSKNVKFYTDFGQTNAGVIGMSRAEIHIKSTLKKMDIAEGTTLWIGWSEKYSHLDKEKIATVFQFRNQPNNTDLAEKGYDEASINSITQAGYTTGGPAIGIITAPFNGQLHYQVSIREGTPLSWQVPENNVYLHPHEIQTDQWYDFIAQIKYSQQADGFLKIWIFDQTNNPISNASCSTAPNWSFYGPTMYTYPSNYQFPIPSPDLRLGIYRHERTNVQEEVDAAHRYMTKYLGPLRLWRGDSNTGFSIVTPR